jgi:hypothetical protein
MPNAETSANDRSSSVVRAETIASLNADGSPNWFIPPYIIPALMALVIAARVIWLS